MAIARTCSWFANDFVHGLTVVSANSLFNRHEKVANGFFSRNCDGIWVAQSVQNFKCYSRNIWFWFVRRPILRIIANRTANQGKMMNEQAALFNVTLMLASAFHLQNPLECARAQKTREMVVRWWRGRARAIWNKSMNVNHFITPSWSSSSSSSHSAIIVARPSYIIDA